MCVTDRHDMTLTVKVALNPNTTKQQTPGLFWDQHHGIENGAKGCHLDRICLYSLLSVILSENMGLKSYEVTLYLIAQCEKIDRVTVPI